MKLKLVNIITIFILIIIVGYVLIPWSKKNIEKENFTVNVYNPSDVIPPSEIQISLYDYLLDNRKISIDLENRIKELSNIMDNNKLVKYEDYKQLIADFKYKLDKEHNSKKKVGSYLLKENEKELVINDLINQIDLLNNKIKEDIIKSNKAQPLQSFNTKNKSIKSMKYGVSISVKELENGLLMIHLNNGCLTYDKQNPDKNYYSVKHCEITNTKQHFVVRKNVKNYVISPLSNLDLCLKIDNVGLSLESYEQQFNPYVSTTPSPTGNVENTLNYPDDFVWVILPIELNGCKKMENKQITIK